MSCCIFSKCSALYYFMQPSTFLAPSSVSDNWDVAEDPVVFSLILILSLMYFSVITAESLRGARSKRRSWDRDERAAAQQTAPIKPRDAAGFPVWHQLSPWSQQTAAEHHHVQPICHSKITAATIFKHVACQRTEWSTCSLKKDSIFYICVRAAWGLLHIHAVLTGGVSIKRLVYHFSFTLSLITSACHTSC